jgi:diacylglycerol kinase family enzyme
MRGEGGRFGRPPPRGIVAPMAHIALIVNPLATAVDEHRIAAVERVLGRYADVRTYFTERRGHATEIARELNAVDAIFVLSGDGGFNEVVNGLADGAPPIACIPGGGTSVFPRGLGLPRDPVRAADILGDAFENGRTRTISVGRVNGRRFLFNSGLLLDAELVRRIEAHRSRDGRPGDAAFIATLLKLIAERRGRFDPVIDVEGLGRVAFLFIANADPYTFLGSTPLHIAPQARLEAGLDAVAPRRVRPHDIPPLLRYVVSGRRPPRSVITLHDEDRIEARADLPLPLQADGEDLGDVTEAIYEVERGALRVLV